MAIIIITTSFSNYSNVWTKEETDTLYWYYEQSRQTDDHIGAIVQSYADNGSSNKTRIAVIQQLLVQDVITLLEYDDLMAAEDLLTIESNAQSPHSMVAYKVGLPIDGNSGGRANDSQRSDVNNDIVCMAKNTITDDIQMLKQRILSDDKGKSLQWLQTTLLDCCAVKLTLKRLSNVSAICSDVCFELEPIPLHYSRKQTTMNEAFSKITAVKNVYSCSLP